MLIVTDGAVDLPPRLSASDGVRVVRGEISVEDQPFRDDEAGFRSLLRSGVFPATTPPTVAALAEMTTVRTVARQPWAPWR
jgi:fatty acid-binding protein DegV